MSKYCILLLGLAAWASAAAEVRLANGVLFCAVLADVSSSVSDEVRRRRRAPGQAPGRPDRMPERIGITYRAR